MIADAVTEKSPLIRIDPQIWQTQFVEHTHFQNLRRPMVGIDITTARRSTLESFSTNQIPVFIDKNGFPQTSPDTPTLLPEDSCLSGRSRLAQSGVEPIDLTILPYNKMTDSERKNHPGMIKGILTIRNVGKRPIVIAENEGIARMFSVKEALPAKGKILGQLLGKGLQIEGEEGKDWIFIDKENHRVTDVNEAVGIACRIGSPQRLLHKRSPLHITTPTIKDYRAVLDRIARRTVAEVNAKEGFWTGKTNVKVTLTQGVFGVIDPEVRIITKYGVKTTQHLNSRLLAEEETKWPIVGEFLTEDSGPLPKDSETWMTIRFYRNYEKWEREKANPYDPLELSVLPSIDPKIKELEKLVAYLEDVRDGRAKFKNGPPFMVIYSTGSHDKQLASLAYAQNGVIPLLPHINQSSSPFTPIEIDLRTGELDRESLYKLIQIYGKKYTREILLYFPHGEGPLSLPLTERIEWQAKLKALQNDQVGSFRDNNYVLATDVTGWLPDGTVLTKSRGNEKQTTLEKIAKAGIINGTVGIAFADLVVSDWPPNFLERFTRPNTERLISDHLNFRVHVHLTPRDILEYVNLAPQELSKSGLGFDAFGKIGHHYVTGIEIEDETINGGWRPVDGLEAWSTVIGYPFASIKKLLQQAQEKGLYTVSDPKHRLAETLMYEKRLLNLLQGKDEMERVRLKAFPV